MSAACQKDKLKFRPNDSSIHPSTAYQPVHLYIHLNWFDDLIVIIIKNSKNINNNNISNDSDSDSNDY